MEPDYDTCRAQQGYAQRAGVCATAKRLALRAL
jgi:hypothetical protein